jgi:hypothetical protein
MLSVLPLCYELATWGCVSGGGIAERIMILDKQYLHDKNYIYITLKQNRIGAQE